MIIAFAALHVRDIFNCCSGVTHSVLNLAPLSRAHLSTPIKCHASNHASHHILTQPRVVNDCTASRPITLSLPSPPKPTHQPGAMSDDKPQFATVPFTSSPPAVDSPSGNTFAPYASLPQVDSPVGNTFGHSGTHNAAGSNAWKGKPRRWIPDLKDPVLHNNRTLVLCFDGTGDQFDSDVCCLIHYRCHLLINP
jgi:hypothetical protein